MNCSQCNLKSSRNGSHFCSRKCRDDYVKTMPFTLTCDGGAKLDRGCDADEGDLNTEAEALAAGWRDISPDPEGVSWNYLGTCPACAADADEPAIVGRVGT